MCASIDLPLHGTSIDTVGGLIEWFGPFVFETDLFEELQDDEDFEVDEFCLCCIDYVAVLERAHVVWHADAVDGEPVVDSLLTDLYARGPLDDTTFED